ncbi:hypothetical protein [Planococcus salinus]|uniref:Uncharacterized protein n=1 Tax=Planococcus salinus TaxID=1848460 RepID=A0A3M8P9A1_9BACL|nr:hypothetical protein [Planococcus salinus]RNF40285.1 hypothetical protein EEX84_06540 [Planococcus salinus]
MSEKEPKEKKYMEAEKKDVPKPSGREEGIKEPRVKNFPKIQVGVAIFVVIVLIIVIIGISYGMYGLFFN